MSQPPNSVSAHDPNRLGGGRVIRTRTLLDPLYGNIALSEEEMSVVDHRLFRRLHRIRQNGLLYFVFSSATHTRFEHSLGVAHTASALVESLYRNSAIAANKPTPAVDDLADAKPGHAVDLSQLDSALRNEFERIVRLAALVHDLGHGPFSHHFDAFAPLVAEVRAVIQSDDDLKGLRDLVPILESNASRKRVPHEVMSCVLFSLVASDLELCPELPRLVSAVLLAEPGLLPADHQLRPYLPLAHDIVASAPADADRMDYLERDSHSIGVSYGLYDRNRLLRTFLCYLDSSKEKHPLSYRLGLKKSGLRAVENFMQARFELFVQVYYHKTNRAVQLMLKEIADSASSEGVSPFNWDSAVMLRKTYGALSDDRFLDVLCGNDPEWKVNHPCINRLARQIQNRELWKRIYEGPDSPEVFDHLHGVDLHGVDPARELQSDTIEPRATKDLDAGASLLIRQFDGTYQVPSQPADEGWLEASPIIRVLHEDEKNIKRVYLRDSNRSKAKDYRRAAWKHLGKLP